MTIDEAIDELAQAYLDLAPAPKLSAYLCTMMGLLRAKINEQKPLQNPDSKRSQKRIARARKGL